MSATRVDAHNLQRVATDRATIVVVPNSSAGASTHAARTHSVSILTSNSESGLDLADTRTCSLKSAALTVPG